MLTQAALKVAFRVAGLTSTEPFKVSLPTGLAALHWHAIVEPSTPDRQHANIIVTFRHHTATAFALHCLGTYGGPRWADRIGATPEVFSGIAPLHEFDDSFRDARFPNLTRSHLGKPASETATEIADSIRQHVVPFVASLTTDEKYLEAISGSHGPLRWGLYGQPLLRAAEIAYLTKLLGRSIQALLPQVAAKANYLKQQLDGVTVDQYMECVIKALPSDA
jgi:hypothetical protein